MLIRRAVGRVPFTDKFLEQRSLLARQLPPCQQLRAPLPGPAQRLLQAPAANRRMISREQHRWHREAPAPVRCVQRAAHLPGGASDAYATGTALTVLCLAGGLPTDASAYQRGIRYLLQSQQADGSWHVVTRSKPVQPYFESGFPHGKDQFISVASSGWATTALILAGSITAARNSDIN